MDGSVAASSNDRVRVALERYRSTSSNESKMQGLFEQLLSLPTTIKSKPEKDRSEDSIPDPTDQVAATSKPAAKSSSDKSEKPREEKADEESTDAAPTVAVAAAPITQLPIIEAQAKPKESTEVKAKPLTAEGEPVAQVVESTAINATAVESSAPIVAAAATEVAPAQVTTAQADDGVAVADTAQPVVTNQVKQVDEEVKVAPIVENTKVEAAEPVRVDRSEKSNKQNDFTDSPKVVDTVAVEERPQLQERVSENDTKAEQHGAEPGQFEIQQTTESSSNKDDVRNSDRREKWYQRDPDSQVSIPESAFRSDQSDKPTDSSLELNLNTQVADATANSTTDIAANSASAATNSTTVDPTLVAAASSVAASLVSGSAVDTKSVGASASDGVSSVSGARGGSSASQTSASGLGTGTASSSTAQANAAGRSGAASSDETGKSAGLSQAERVRLVQRVARSFNRLGPDGGQVTLKLHPPQLGVLNMTVKIEGQTLTAKFQTESTEAQRAILDNLPVLRDRLAEQGIDVGKVQVDVGTQQDFAMSGGNTQSNFQGGSSSGNDTSSREIDYRRLSRSDSTYSRRASMGDGRASALSWGTPSIGYASTRTLDVEA